ncbi:hypothetical protein SEA_BUTTERBALL_95 [Gordonia phage Butterball]|uniref:Uncharacterized protein n=4 Tax=Montyvirus TaxID=2733196 RepID=A0A2L1IWN9_9CAUD|nr:hypothetical protein HOS45_gp038 [Gordonia phage BirksAndSocks]YP_009843088.1 hypothetical protein HWC02_gp038 [Gordonia phage Sombrero]AVD99601.1 hypothetical protein SEA_BONEHAM_96 [Gordonia phage Boneham]QAY16733.1 hypothetical protein SEA_FELIXALEJANDRO_97 [Gordonia phage FelixAlejandro]QAY17019.1 hypothetical protein SEA_BUTTERBALL_95 [Gordonia phage Butterball]AUE22207.1 hypothetical protein SEA_BIRKSANDSOCKS_97 [Gordonia phage BirksAndSocks]QAY04054.1 hypothetical protein SEA_SOMBRE
MTDPYTSVQNQIEALKKEVVAEQKRHTAALSSVLISIDTLETWAAKLALQGSVAPTPAAGTKVRQRIVSAGPINPTDGRSRFSVTSKQRNFIEKLCDEKFARVDPPISTMLEASQVIAELKVLGNVAEEDRDYTGAIGSGTPQPAQPVTDKLDMNVLRMIPDGRYAVTSDDGKQTVFLKLATRTIKGSNEEFRDLRYKSSDDWLELQKFYQSGMVTGRNEVHGSVVADLLVQVMMDKGGCADRYGERFKECVNCGRELTDDKSRYYRLGSECITRRHDVVEYVDDNFGAWTPGAASRD